MTPSFEASIQAAVERKEIPGAILFAEDATGAFSYTKTFGHDSCDPDAAPMTPEVFLYGASCTKLLTSVAVMKALELGLLPGLDAAVADVLPELAAPRIVSKAAEGGFRYAPAQTPITYRQLLTHTSGLGYGFLDPLLMEWNEAHPNPGGSVPAAFAEPLRFEPGSTFNYSCSTDWAGLAVERTSKMDLEGFFKTYILDPVGVIENGITFYRGKLAGARVAKIAERMPDTGKLETNTGVADWLTADFCQGGQGIILRPDQYMKVLRSLLRDDGKILRSEELNELFRPQLTEHLRSTLKEAVYANEVTRWGLERGITSDSPRDHGLGGMIDVDGRPGGRGKGTMMWGGHPNLEWFVDREKGLCGFYGVQISPFGDPKAKGLGREFEEGIYEVAGKTADA